MADFATVASLLSTVAGTALKQQQAQQSRKSSQAAMELQATQVRQNQAMAEKNRRYQLKKDLAARRAQQGASGIGGVGGSNEAVLDGLSKQATEDIQAGTEVTNQRLAAIRNRMNRNLLSEKQAQQRQLLSSGQTIINQLL